MLTLVFLAIHQSMSCAKVWRFGETHRSVLLFGTTCLSRLLLLWILPHCKWTTVIIQHSFILTFFLLYFLGFGTFVGGGWRCQRFSPALGHVWRSWKRSTIRLRKVITGHIPIVLIEQNGARWISIVSITIVGFSLRIAFGSSSWFVCCVDARSRTHRLACGNRMLPLFLG